MPKYVVAPFAVFPLIFGQAIRCNRDTNALFFVRAKDFQRDNVANPHVEHHIDDVILTGDLGGVAVHGGADENVLGLKDSVCERAA